MDLELMINIQLNPSLNLKLNLNLKISDDNPWGDLNMDKDDHTLMYANGKTNLQRKYCYIKKQVFLYRDSQKNTTKHVDT